MLLGLVGAFGAALCYGIGSVLQAVAARGTENAEGLDPRLLLRLVRSWRYVVGVGLDALGFVLSLAAVRTLPLRWWDKIALGVVIGGLVLVGLSAAEDGAVNVSRAEQWGVLGFSVLLALLAIPLARITAAAGAAGLGAIGRSPRSA